MKKVLAFILSVVFASMFVMNCSAYDELTQKKQTAVGDVYAKYTEQTEGIYKAEVSNGEAKIIIDGETVVHVSGIKDDSLVLVVCPITADDEDAYTGLSEKVKDYGTLAAAYDIYLENSLSQRVPFTQGISIRLALPEGCKNPAVLYLPADNGVTKLDFTEDKRGMLLFTASSYGCYIIAQENAPSTSSSDNQNTGADSNPPNTGDQSTTLLWTCVMILSAVLILVLNKRHIFRNKDEN